MAPKAPNRCLQEMRVWFTTTNRWSKIKPSFK